METTRGLRYGFDGPISVHEAFDDDADNVGTHDLVKELATRGFAVVKADEVDRAISRARESEAKLNDLRASLGALADTVDQAGGFPELTVILRRLVKESAL